MAKPRAEEGGADQRAGIPAEVSRIEFDLDAWPMVRLQFVGRVTPQHFRESVSLFVAAFDRAENEGRRIDWLLHFGRLAPLAANAAMRQEAAAIARSILPRMTAVTHAEACVINHPVVRGLFTAMTWILPLPWPAEVFATETDAIAWLQKMRKRCDEASLATATSGPRS